MDLFVVIKLRDQLVELKAWVRLRNAALQILDAARNHPVIDVLDRLGNFRRALLGLPLTLPQSRRAQRSSAHRCGHARSESRGATS